MASRNSCREPRAAATSIAGARGRHACRLDPHPDARRLGSLGDNNISFADVIVRQVLQKRHRALVVLGTGHVMKSKDRTGSDNTTVRIENYSPGSTFVLLLLYAGVLDRATEDSLGLPFRDRPVLYELSATHIGQVPYHNGPPLSQTADALLYVAPRAAFTQALPPKGSLDAAYMREVDRRSMIEWGELRARQFLGAAAR
jgi:hypothetical protein